MRISGEEKSREEQRREEKRREEERREEKRRGEERRVMRLENRSELNNKLPALTSFFGK